MKIYEQMYVSLLNEVVTVILAEAVIFSGAVVKQQLSSIDYAVSLTKRKMDSLKALAEMRDSQNVYFFFSTLNVLMS